MAPLLVAFVGSLEGWTTQSTFIKGLHNRAVNLLPTTARIDFCGIWDIWAGIVAFNGALLANPEIHITNKDFDAWSITGCLQLNVADHKQSTHVLGNDPLHMLAALPHEKSL